MLLGLVLSPGLADDQRLAGREKAVKRASTFVEPILSAEETAPDENESQNLQFILEAARTKVSEAQPNDKAKAASRARQEEIAALEDFISAHPDSAWTPSVRANLGKYHRQRGRYTLALEHWAAAWEATKHQRNGHGKMVADYVLAHWTRLLASLGRSEALESLLRQNRERVLDQGPLSQMWARTREAFTQMQARPGLSYQCGTYALDAVARLKGSTHEATALLEVPSPAAGFTMKKLDELSRQFKLGLVAVQRTRGEELIVPSVIHWRQNHYGAIVRQQGELYEVADPTFEDPQFLSAEAINAEASGNFFIPISQIKAGWRELTPAEAERIFGRGNPNFMADANDQVCLTGCPPGCPPGTMGLASNGEAPCGGCGGEEEWGMPGWSVSEPYINLWLRDEPLRYQPAQGRRISLVLRYKQRDEFATPGGMFNFGKSWQSSWLSYVETIAGTPATTAVYVYLPGGGRARFNFSNGEASNYYNNLRLRVLTSSGNVTGYELLYPDGSKTVYGFFRTYPNGTWDQVFMSKQHDPQDRKTQFRYPNYDPNSLVVRLEEVIDPDNRTTRLFYETNFVYWHDMVTRVVDPFGRTARFTYIDSGQLQEIEDVAGIRSRLQYGIYGWPSTLTTPYGATSFAHTGEPTGLGEDIDRHLIINVPGGGRHVYAYVQFCENPDYAPYLPAAYPSTEVPQGTPIGTLDNGPGRRNSFYWGPRQAADLPATVYDFTNNHFRKARMRHWLIGTDSFGPRKSVDTLSIERDYSPDSTGATEGQKTWYDYAGKLNGQPSLTGSQILPSIMARRLPDGSTWYEYYVRDSSGRPLSITSTYGTGMNPPTRTHSYTYSSDGIDLLEERSNQLLRSFTYNAFHQPLTIKEVVDGSTTYTNTFTYDATTRQVTSILRPDGITTTFSYDADRRLSQTIDQPVYRVHSYTYQWNGLPYSHTDPRGLTRIFAWDDLQRLVYISFLDNTYIQHTYNRLDRSGTRDRLGNWTVFNYNALRQLTSQVDPLNRTTSYTYCACGALESITNPLNQTTTFLYDSAGRRTRTLFPDGTKEDYTYDLLSQLTQTKDNSGTAVASYSYNNQGLLIAVHNSSSDQISSIGYDVDDRPTSMNTAGGPSVTQAFDRLGRLISRSLDGGGTETFGYSALGLASSTNALSQKTSYSYDLANRKITVTNAKNETTQFYFTMAGDLQTLYDAKNQYTSWTYDSEGRLTAKSESGAPVMSANYNVNGRMNWRSTPAKGTTYYSYDTVGNLTTINFPNSPDVSYAYDALNRLASMSDAIGSTTFSYTSFGALAEENPPWANDAVNYTFDQNRRRSRMTQLKPDGSAWTQDYAYDSAWRLQSISSPAGTFTNNYAGASGLVTGIGLPTGGSISKAYDGLARLTSTSLGHSSGSTLNVHSYLYNNAHQRTRQNRSGNYVDYGYDAIGQLTSANGFENGGTIQRRHEKLSYAYDAGGNLTQRWNDSLNETLTLGGRNQLTSGSYTGPLTVAGMTAGAVSSLSVNGQSGTVYGDGSFAVTNVSLASSYTATVLGGAGNTATDTIAVSAPGTVYFYHDANGNMTGDSQRSFLYDDENQLTRATVSGAGWVDYTYDGLRRKRFRQEYNASGGLVKVTKYLYDGMQVIQERDVYEQVAASYTRGLDLSGTLEGAGGIGGLLARTDNSGSAYYHSDGSGNVTMLINASQQVVAKYLYDPFGNLLGMSGSLAEVNPYRFSSKEYDSKAGLYYYGFRFYEPSLQRWLNQDPIGEAGGLNLYGFVGNNPISFIDPYGLEVGFWEGLIPVWGSGKQACEDFGAGRWGWGTLNTAVAASDVIPIRAAVGAVGKGVWKCGSHTWSATSKWLTKCGWREFKGQEIHHTFIPRNDWGKTVPDWLKNQPWNLMPTKNQIFHDALHGVGESPFNFGQRLWYGSPKWLKAGAFSVGGKEANWLGNGDGSSFLPPLVPRSNVGNSLSPTVPAPFSQ